jgi:ubiquitin-like modifier-activating enzyme ATG7
MEIIKYQTWSSAVDISFWHEFGKRKLDEYKLSEAGVPLTASYTASLRSSKQTLSLLNLDLTSFQSAERESSIELRAGGTAYNCNTMEDFKCRDKAELMRVEAARLYSLMCSGEALRTPSLLLSFFVLSFMDLKKYNYFFMFGFPALKFDAPVRAPLPVKLADATFVRQRQSAADNFAKRYFELSERGNASFFSVVVVDDDDFTLSDDLSSALAVGGGGESVPIVGFSDPSALDGNPGWPMRNLLALLAIQFEAIDALDVVCVRHAYPAIDCSDSVVFRVSVPAPPDSWRQHFGSQQSSDAASSSTAATATPVTGWERDKNNRIAPRLVRLGKMMDPAKLAATSVALNLKLMRWRVLPSLKLERIAGTRCLLIGAGTLGCNVARSLMGWGVRSITLVDNGRVSHSNPARQSLFTFADAKHARHKASAAAANLKAIFPGIESRGIVLTVPMPGHSISESERDGTVAAVDQLVDLVKQSDVVFLLTDSRESRWLPTLLCAAANRLCINSALGFDTYVVMRHGLKKANDGDNHNGGNGDDGDGAASSSSSSAVGGGDGDDVELGCYFCNDVVAPQDSLTDRTLDQQCTVTRPGLSMMASSLAVELMVSLVQHADGGFAPADVTTPPSEPTTSLLGLIPHQMRGFLTHFQTLLVVGQAYDKCTACSHAIIAEYRARGIDFLIDVFNEPAILERVSGLAELGNDELDDMTLAWDDADDSDSDFDI